MKKYAVALFAGLLILAIAAPLFAETYIDGLVFYRPRIYYNTDFLKDNPNTNDARILPILWVGAGYKAEDYAEGYFRLGTLGGGYALGGADYAGEAPNGESHPVSLQQVWFDVKIPGTPVHYRLGRFAQSLGHGFVMNTGAYGGDGMKFYAPIGPAKVELGYMKYNEQGDFANDIDQYFLQATAPLAEKHQIGGYFQWFEGRNLNINSNATSRQLGGYDHMFTMWDPSITFDSHIWALGISADGAIDMISYRAEVAYAGGKLTDDFKKTDAQQEEKIGGFALMAGATANLGPATVTFEGAYGSGDKRKKLDGDVKNLGSGTKYEGFKVPMAQWGRTVVYDEWSFFHQHGQGDPFDFAPGFGGGVTNNHEKRTGVWTQRGLENQIYLTIGATYTPITPVTLGVDIFKIWAAQTTPKGGFDPDSRIIYKKKQDRDVGWEIDLTAKWTLNKNFSVTGAFAPFIPGDYFKVAKGSQYVGDPTVYDPGDPTTYDEVEKTSSPSWGYVMRANCIFSF